MIVGTEKEKLTTTIKFRVSESEKRKIVKAAKAKGLTVTEYIKNTLFEAVPTKKKGGKKVGGIDLVLGDDAKVLFYL